MVSVLRQHVDAAVQDERVQALRRLLQRPLLTAAVDGEAVALVRRHRDWLRDWLLTHAGWVLHVEAELVRLVKTPALARDDSHPARDPQHRQPFTRRRYVCWCLALAALERAGRQTTLARLAEDIQVQLAGDPVLTACGLSLERERRDHRSDLVAVGRSLLEHGVIHRVHGDEAGFLDGSGDCLYAINRPVLARLLAVRVGPSLVESEDVDQRLAELQREPSGEGETEARRRIRRRLVRWLLERPVLRFDDLDPAEHDYLKHQRASILKELCAATGLVAELRAEGIALVDPRRELSDFQLPQEGTTGHAALILAEHLAAGLRAVAGFSIDADGIEAVLAEAARRHARLWRRDTATVDGVHRLAGELIDRFCALDLLRVEDGRLHPQPAVARYAMAVDVETGEGDEPAAQTSLFEETP